MSGHTATPFAPFLPLTVTHNSWRFSTIYDANNNAVCRLDLEDWAVTEDNQDTLEALQEKYAAFIVTACNSHAKLVNTLEVFADAANYYDDANLSPGEQPWRDDHPANPVFKVGQLRAARAALATLTARKMG